MLVVVVVVVVVERDASGGWGLLKEGLSETE